MVEVTGEPLVLEELRAELAGLVEKVEAAIAVKPRLLNDKEAARYVGMSEAFLRRSRSEGVACRGPEFVRVGGCVRYAPEDLDKWIEERRSKR